MDLFNDLKSDRINQLSRLLLSVRFRFCSELDLQDGVEQLLQQHKLAYVREKSLSAQDRPDFVVDGNLAIEIKIQGTLAQALRQIHRYSQHREITSILLVGSPSWILRVPTLIGGKPVTAIRITESLL